MDNLSVLGLYEHVTQSLCSIQAQALCKPRHVRQVASDDAGQGG